MKTNIFEKLPTYKPSEKVWQHIEKELDTLQYKRSYTYIWTFAASFILAFFTVLSFQKDYSIKNGQGTQIVYAEEVLDSALVEKVFIPVVDIEIESLCEMQPVKCQDEYAQSLLKQIQDLSDACSELEQSTEGQSIPDVAVQKQKAHLEKEKHKRIKKLKRYLNE